MPKSSKQDQKRILACALCALLNSGGGVVRAEIANEGYSLQRDGIGLDLEQTFQSLLLYPDWEIYLDCEQRGNDLLIFVKTWSSEITSSGSASAKPRICSLSTGLYSKCGASLSHMSPSEALLFLTEKQVKARSCLSLGPAAEMRQARDVEGDRNDAMRALWELYCREQLRYGEKFAFTESRYVEFKHYSTDHLLTRVREVLPQYIAAFANTGGGYLWIGVDDDGRVQGFSCEDEELHKLRDLISSICGKLTYFHMCQSGASCQLLYEEKTFPVQGEAGEPCGHVCAVKVLPLACVVFAEAPDSWLVEGSTMRRLGGAEWAARMTDTDPDLLRLSSIFSQELSVTEAPPLAKPVYSHRGADSAATLCEKLFPVRPSSITYTPEKLSADLLQEHPGLDTLLQSQLQHLSEGVLVFSRSWAVEVGLPANSLILCDVLQVAKDRPPVLYTVCSQLSEGLFEYCRRTAWRLKEKLVNTGGYIHKLCVIPKLLALPAQGSCGEEGDLSIEEMYPPHYGMVSNGNLRDLLRALTVALLTFKSFLSDRVGYEFLNLLTFKQYELLSENLHRTKKLYVYGLPGTGKTVLAMKIMEKIRIMLQCSQEEVLYICETKGLRDFVQEENICQAATRVEFLQGSFGEVKHIIIDEAQSFRDEEGDWYEKAMRLTSSPDLPEPGFLWIFLDYLQTCHNFPTGLPDAGRHDPVESLTQVVRSSNSVYGYVRNTMKNVVEGYAQGIPLQRLKRLVERATCAHPVKGKLEIRMMESGEIIKYVVEHCREYSRNGHSCTDLAVLFYEHEGVFTEYCKSCLEGELQTSSRIPFKRMDNSSWRECAVVDSIQNFAGLERSIVFGILPVSVQKLEHLLTTGLVWIASRATLHLHVLFEAEPKLKKFPFSDRRDNFIYF